MKLIKFILKLVLFLVLIIVFAVGILLWVAYDDTKSKFVPSDETLSIEEVISNGVYDSIDSISKLSKTNRENESNRVDIDISTDDLNNLIVEFVRSNGSLNSEYLKDEDNDYIIKKAGLTLHSITFEEGKDSLDAFASITGLGFYHTTVKISGKPKLEDKKLVIEFDNFRLGKKIKVSRARVLSLFDKFNISFNNQSIFDVNTLTLTLDLTSYIESISNSNKLLTFLNNGEYSLNMYNKDDKFKIGLGINTKDIFSNVTAVPSASVIDFDPSLVEDFLTDPKVNLTESQFNYLIKNSLNESEGEFNQTITMSGHDFTFNLNSMYYNFDTDEVLALVKINELECNMALSIKITKEYDGSYISNLVLKIQTIKVGKTIIDAKGFVSDVKVPASTLTPDNDHLKLEDITFNKTNETCSIDYAYVI